MPDARFSGTERYLNTVPALDSHRAEFERYLTRIEHFVELGPGSRVFEVGVGSGWFLVLCAERGFQIAGLELNPVFARRARELAAERGLELDLMEGSIEDTDIGEDRYDVIFASSVFEHVRLWQQGLERIHRALRHEGVLHFYSTNRFSLRSGEKPGIPLYGWLPDRYRHALRVWLDGIGLVGTSGIDFNQFTHSQLRREFNRIGFSRIYDTFELPRSDQERQELTGLRRAALSLGRRSAPIAAAAQTFAPGTSFICVK